MIFEIPKTPAALIDRLRARGHKAYIVGGCVRDTLMGREPEDYDLCASAAPEEVIRIFSDHRVVPTGIRHGTVTVIEDGAGYEITTFRIDGSYSDSRRPDSVRFTDDIREDLARRDFTMNAIAYSPYEGLIDPFGGRDDIEKKLIRCVGNPAERFGEDALRILRAWRFSAKLGFEIEARTAAAAQDAVGLLKSVSAERIREELRGMLRSPAGFAERVLRENSRALRAVLGVEPVNSCALAAAEGMDEITRLAVFFGYTLGQSGAECADIMRRLKFDGASVAAVSELVTEAGNGIAADTVGIKRGLNRIGKAQYRRLIDVSRAIGETDKAAEAERRLDRIIAEKQCFKLADLAVSGADFIAEGYSPGRTLGTALSALLDEVIRGAVKNERTALLAEGVRILNDKNK